VAPEAAWKVPAAHDEHAAEATAAAYRPAPQLMQVADSEAPVRVEYLPPAQLVQLLAPVCVWYVPAGQLLQLEAATAE
jgi:hypothetical protein